MLVSERLGSPLPYEALVRETELADLVPTCIQVRGVKVKVEQIDIPVPFAAAFELAVHRD